MNSNDEIVVNEPTAAQFAMVVGNMLVTCVASGLVWYSTKKLIKYLEERDQAARDAVRNVLYDLQFEQIVTNYDEDL